MSTFFNELKRRNVVRVAVAYLILGWLVFQIAETLLPGFGGMLDMTDNFMLTTPTVILLLMLWPT